MSGEMPRVGVVGASGFVGGAAMEALHGRADSTSIRAPRLSEGAGESESCPAVSDDVVNALARELEGLDVVVNAAGNPDASSPHAQALIAANALVPVALLRACQRVGVRRFIHISSAVVQGDKPELDASMELRPFSAYSHSKAQAEKWLLAEPRQNVEVVIYRPPSVHGRGRGVTRKVAALASSPLRSVAGSGSQQTPQALLANVAHAIAFLAVTAQRPPEVVHHPWEGLTASALMRSLGGKEPRHLPVFLCSAIVCASRGAERAIPRLSPYRRRVELMWFGQRVAPSWLEASGWSPVVLGDASWEELGRDEHCRIDKR